MAVAKKGRHDLGPARPAIRAPQRNPDQPVNGQRTVQKRQCQEPGVKNPQDQPKTGKGKKHHAARTQSNVATGKPEHHHAQVQFPGPVRFRADPPINHGAQQQQRTDEGQQVPAPERLGGSAGRSVPIKVAGLRFTNGSKRFDRQLSHSNSPARFKMKSTMPIESHMRQVTGGRCQARCLSIVAHRSPSVDDFCLFASGRWRKTAVLSLRPGAITFKSVQWEKS